MTEYPAPTYNFKNSYHFALATTSFIYPDYMAPNVRVLGTCFDEIELLFFESAHERSLPKPSEIRELAELSGELELSYNVHLPLDVSLTSPDPLQRERAADTVKHIIDLAGLLSPTTWTLHLPMEEGEKDLEEWRSRAAKGLESLTPGYIEGRLLSIETLSYPLDLVEDIIEALDLSICLDIGHMSIHGLDWQAFYKKYESRIPVIHLYGFGGVHEHLGLDSMPWDIRRPVSEIISRFHGTLCLEVFSYPHLQASLAALSEMA